jgi:pimeloyl-ACP methyl ester carboxylesterase
MATSVYKTEKGRALVESYYRDLLGTFKAIPFQQFRIPTSAGTTHVIHCGDDLKPALILLHGSMSNSAAWLGILKDFADSFSLYCVDIPGEPGLSDPIRMSLGSREPSNFNPVMDSVPLFTDDELKRLTMPVQYFGGDRDALLDTKKSAARLSALLPKPEINVLEDTGHVIVDQFAAAKAFLSKSY